MGPEEREAYLKKKKEEAKVKFREMMKQKWADAKKVGHLNFFLRFNLDKTVK